jgi:hypothetical protein
MKLEQILAENILRFGAKNLDGSAINQINRILEQADPNAVPKSIDELQDSEQVKAAPGYADVLGKLIDLAKGENKTGNNFKSLNYWRGSITDNKNVRYTDDIINALPKVEAFLNSAETPAGPFKTNMLRSIETSQLKTFIEKLKSLKQNNVYIDFTGLDRLQRATLASNVKKLDNDKVANILGAAVIEIPKVLPKIDQQGKDGKDLVSKTVVAQITDADKIALLAGAQEQLAAKKEGGAVKGAGSGGIRIGRTSLNAVDSITIAPKNEIANIVKTVKTIEAQNPDPIIQAFVFPDISKPNLVAQNFFGDNESQVTPEQKQKFAELLATAVKSFTDQGVTISEVRYNAGSSTSKVWTKYIGAGRLSAASSPNNNKILAQDRCNSIAKTLADVISENPSTSKLKKTDLGSSVMPNQGPDYKQGQWKFGTDGKIAPDQKEAYESTYGKHRFSFGQFTLVGTKAPDTKPPTEETTFSGKGAWRISLNWKTLKINPPRFSPGASVTTYPTNGSGIACPKF